MSEIPDFLQGLNESLYENEMELAAIWLERPVHTATERTARLTDGHMIKVVNGEIVDCLTPEHATHQIIGCYGTVASNKLSMALIDLKTNEPSILKLK